MVSEFIIHRMRWDSIWYAHPGAGNYFSFGPRWHVGIWTGPHVDLICTRRCETTKEANVFLSPGGWTIFHAIALALIKEFYLRITKGSSSHQRKDL